MATYEEAAAAARAAEEAFATELPGRAQEFADRVSALLPDGMRFEWAAGPAAAAEFARGMLKEPPPERVQFSYPVFPADSVIPDHCTPEMIADPSLGACKRVREGCIELGPWLPNYQGYVCGACVRADEADIRAHRWPFPEHGGPGIPGQYG